MAEMTREERFRRAKEAHARAEAEKSNGGFEKVEVPEMECVVLKPNKCQIIRLVGESLEMSESDTDPILVERSLCKDDDGNWFTIIWSKDPEHPMNKLKKTILGKYTWDDEIKKKIYDNRELPIFKRFTSNGTGNVFDQGCLPQTYVVMNCITRGENDNWCKEHKHTKMLCWDVNESEKDGKTMKFYTYGAKKSLYNKVWDEMCTIRNRHFEDFDILVRRLDKKTKIGENTYLVINSAEEKSVISNWESKDGAKYLEYMNDKPLSNEEKNYERYVTKDVPFITKATPVGVLLKHFSKLIKSADSEFGTHLYDEFVEWKAKEIEASKKAKEENSENEEVEETNEVEKEEPTTNFDSMENVSSDDLPSEVEESPKPMKKVMKTIKTTTFNPLSLKDLFPSIVDMKEEDRNLIVGCNENTGELIYKEGTETAMCPNCNMDIPDAWSSCVCGVSFIDD